MPIDLGTLGTTTQPHPFTYDASQTVLYALGIGAKRAELDYLYEGHGPKVYPTFAVVPVTAAVTECLTRSGADLAMIVHGAQSVVVHRELPPAGTVSTVATIDGLYDLKRLAQIVIRTTTTDATGAALFDTSWSIIVRGGGGFGGKPPPKRDDVSAPKDRPADVRVEEATTPEQALLYRLSGDRNPLHADPVFAAQVGFEKGPILHGLCTYGFALRALVGAALDGDASRVARLDATFRNPVWPGETLVTEGYRLEGGVMPFVTRAAGRTEVIMTGTMFTKG